MNTSSLAKGLRSAPLQGGADSKPLASEDDVNITNKISLHSLHELEFYFFLLLFVQ